MCLAIPGCVISIDGQSSLLRTALVDFGGIRKVVNLAFLPEAEVGDYVLVHVGFALSCIDEEEAGRVSRRLATIEELSVPVKP